MKNFRGSAASVGERSQKFFYHLVAQINLRIAQFQSRYLLSVLNFNNSDNFIHDNQCTVHYQAK